uniref:SAP domain-containing protein n=1 Tax=viral metagenome TaxID=1070528 RepID=A0A6C0IFX3_9ZZZZ
MNPEELKRLNAFIRQNSKPELTKQCLEKNLSVKGTKHDMAVRLLGISMRPSIAVEDVAQRPILLIRRNQHGRYVHDPTRLVFDKLSRKVVGREGKNGEVNDLQRNDIQVCQQYKFQYVLPEYLDDPPYPLEKKMVREKELVSDEEDEVEEDEE